MATPRPAVHPFHDAATGTWSYVVADPATNASWIIDPVLDFDASSGRTATGSAQRMLDTVAASGYRVTAIVETHAHADHLSAAAWLKKKLAVPVMIGAGIVQVQAHFGSLFDFDASFAPDGSQFERLLADGERLALGEIPVQALSVPGHTSDSLAFLIGDALFTGDSLFMPDSGTARCDFPGGDAATLYRSIQRLFALPDATRVFVCHDYAPGGRGLRCETSIGAQKAANIHVGGGCSEAEFVLLRTARDATLAMPTLMLPALQVNLRAGQLPEAGSNDIAYLKIPLNRL
jgi:glyoxylase-like metal-dependent hydrolase (beta-lactamase superfamily II)